MGDDFTFTEIIDGDKIKDILESFFKLTGVPSTLIDVEGNILTTSQGEWVAAGWQDICLHFHRKHPQTLKNCIQSDTQLAGQLDDKGDYSWYQCPNGLVDAAVPIYIDGRHMANLFTGQFFFEKPDTDFFRNQAQKYGFDEEEYMQALSKVPVVSRDFVQEALIFLTRLAEMIGNMSLDKKRLMDSHVKIIEGKELLNTITSNIPGIVFQFLLKRDGSQSIPYASPGSYELMGVDSEQIVEDVNNLFALVLEEDLQEVLGAIQESSRTLTTFNVEFRIEHPKTDKITWLKVKSTPYKLNSGDILWNGVALDITERKEAETELQNRLQEKEILNQVITDLIGVTHEKEIFKIIYNTMRQLLPGVIIGISYISPDKTYLKLVEVGGQQDYQRINKFLGSNIKKIKFKLDEFTDETLNKSLSGKLERYDEGIHGLAFGQIPQPLCKLLEKALKINEIYSMGFIGENLYGGLLLAIPRGSELNHQELIEDIMRQSSIVIQRVRANKKLEDSLQEKEVLLGEIHHRVKNNMQIISSLISLQAEYLPDETACNAFLESQNRIKSMALVHEGLYRSDNVSDIDSHEYLQGLVTNLFNTYAAGSRIKTKLDVQGKLNLETAIPLGLITNELVTNSLKHAFPQGREGTISITLKPWQDHYLFLVEDDGVGMPPDLDINKLDTLGLQLVSSLVKQLDGVLTIESPPGTVFRMEFDELNYKTRL